MLATALSDTALVIGALSALVAAAAGFVSARRGGRVEAKVGAMSVVVDGIDHATNRQPAHAPTLPQRLDRIEKRLATFLSPAELEEKFAAVHEQFDTVNGRLDDMAATAARHHPEDQQ